MLKIDDEFKKLIPPLSADEFKQLEENILSEGIREKIIVWQGIIIDGHNRFKISQSHGIKFETLEKEFESREDVKIWIIKNQFGRRNLSAYDRSKLALELEPLIAGKARENLKTAGENFGKGLQNSAKAIDKVDTRAELATIAGVSHDTIAKVKVIEQKATEDVKEKLSSGEISINQAYQDIKKEEKKIEIKEKALELKNNPISLPEGEYNVIYADPPWKYDNSGFEMSAANQYPLMTIEEMIKEIKFDTSKNAVLFLWVTNPLLQESFDLIKGWGFEYKTNFVWVKERHTAGFYVFGQHEILMICTKGSMLPMGEKYKSIINGSNKIHSKKPEIVYEIIESMYPGQKYLELFSRSKRKNWYSWGNQV